MYVIGGFSIAFIVIFTICFLVWFYHWKKRAEIRRFKRLSETTIPSHQVVKTKIPDITINTIKFTLPQPNIKQSFSRTSDGNDGSYILDKKLHQSSGDVQDYTIVDSEIGSLLPSLYQKNEENEPESDELPPDNNGRVYFSLEYEAESERLIISLDKILNLLGRNRTLQPSISCDPFIRLYLLPDEKRYLQSKMKRKTRNPVFKETFIFAMSYALLIERTLRITVFDVDRFMRQNTIGHILYPLDGLNATMVTEVSRDVDKFSQICCSSGRLQIGLTHFPGMNKVAVNIIRGLQLGEEHGDPAPDSYVKATYLVLNKIHKVKKTTIYKNSYEPFFNQTMDFKVDPSYLDASCITFEIFQHIGGMKTDRSLGSFILGGNLCSRGKELEHWENMLQKPQVIVKEWHDLIKQ